MQKKLEEMGKDKYNRREYREKMIKRLINGGTGRGSRKGER